MAFLPLLSLSCVSARLRPVSRHSPADRDRHKR